MAKNGLTYSIAILMISLFISISCSSSAITNKFHETILEDPYWTTSIYDATFNLLDCLDNCKMHNAHDQTKRKECILQECINTECQERHPNNKEKREACIDYLDTLFGQ
ncbi:hypothetical protein PIB30_020521 [Stylosanthes scabra]|uniref:Transmembrane protein n=1 Tax=Stylosanthes scabra TaxID=79078 RepID=A0ABU6YAH3_9FABA|nr:hypothetical protein [Stylosanthes scabra]